MSVLPLYNMWQYSNPIKEKAKGMAVVVAPLLLMISVETAANNGIC